MHEYSHSYDDDIDFEDVPNFQYLYMMSGMRPDVDRAVSVRFSSLSGLSYNIADNIKRNAGAPNVWSYLYSTIYNPKDIDSQLPPGAIEGRLLPMAPHDIPLPPEDLKAWTSILFDRPDLLDYTFSTDMIKSIFTAINIMPNLYPNVRKYLFQKDIDWTDAVKSERGIFPQGRPGLALKIPAYWRR